MSAIAVTRISTDGLRAALDAVVELSGGRRLSPGLQTACLCFVDAVRRPGAVEMATSAETTGATSIVAKPGEPFLEATAELVERFRREGIALRIESAHGWPIVRPVPKAGEIA